MPQNYSGRITLILVVLVAAMYAIFPPGSLFAPTFSQKLALKPGIDMVGGTSLLYEIKPPEGTAATPDLSERVMEALKRRVDPDGVRNLIWRPQAGNRLEIQMPTSTQSEKAKQARQLYTDASDQLAATNVGPSEILNAVEKSSGAARTARLDKWAMGSASRGKLFGSLCSTYDQIQMARKKGDANLQAQKENEYDDLKAQLEDSNLGVNDLEGILALANPQARQTKLNALKAKFADFPPRLAAIDSFDKAYAAYSSVKGSIDDAGELKRLLKGSGVLEFHILVTDLSSPEAQDLIRRLHQKGPGIEAGDTMRWFQLQRPEETHNPGRQLYNDKYWLLAWVTPERSMDNRGTRAKWALENARPEQGQTGLTVVGFRFNPQGAQYFSVLTRDNIGKPLAIMLDDKIISAPNINSQIGREGIIEGGENGYTHDELSYLVNTLNAGSLPAQLADEPISERTVEPQLGAANLRAGLIASLVGLVIVAVFLISYYRLAGIVATFAVFMNVVLILGAMAAFNATFTLPGIAGIVLTVGAAVDANVLIFERLREEQHRGLSLRMALRNAYARAFSAILDSNVTTIITAVVLYWLGSEEVKGFGLTLLIGLVGSLFTALFVTKTIFGVMIDKFGLKHLGSLPLSFPKWDKMLKPNIDWMGLAWIFITFSCVFITVGMIAFVVKARQHELLDIEFAGGTSVQFELKAPMPKEQVEQVFKPYAVDQGPLPAATVLKMGNSLKEYEVVTPNADSAKVKQAVLEALGPKLKLQLPSTFDGVGGTVDAAMDPAKSVVLPVENSDFAVKTTVKGPDGKPVDKSFQPRKIPNHVGGVAIVLRDLEPALTPSEIKARIERQRLQPQAGLATQTYREFDVANEFGNDEPTNLAVVLVSDPSLPYATDPAKWREDLAAPMWQLVNEAVNKPPQLQKVSNFGAQVAGDTQANALLAMTLSLIVIMAYIWLRFGNMTYATATVVAMIHDTLVVLGAIGLSHYAGDSAIGRWLLVDTFRVNLTIVAAILTVMSYSMIDTIVVFDRIRENRGKYGHLDRQVINDGINQTLSRTLLTAVTNICTVLVMYILGGPGIHGFTFVLSAGILVGTYSSVAIAAPMLLVGGKRQAEVSRKPSAGAVQKLGT